MRINYRLKTGKISIGIYLQQLKDPSYIERYLSGSGNKPYFTKVLSFRF